MKRFFALVALVLGLASCQTEPEGLDVQMGGAVDATITVNIPDSETRAGGTNSALSVFENGILDDDDVTMRYILMIYDAKGQASKDPHIKYNDGKSVNFDVRLVPDRDYTFVVWADVVKKNDAGEWTDLHYITTTNGVINLANITVNENTWVAMDESRDAFTVSEVITDYNGGKTIELKLKRPFAKLRVVTTDIEELDDLRITPTKATVSYTSNLYNSFNAFDGTVAGEMKPSQTAYEIAHYTDNDFEGEEQSMVLFTDYIFAPKGEDGAVRFELTVYDQNGTDDVNKIKFNNFNTDIKTHRNYLTTISGNILTDGNKIKVDIQNAFENVDNDGNITNPDYDYETISSVAELLAAIDANSGKYIVITDLDVNEVTASTQAATRTTGTGTTINLNGYTITLKTNITIAEDKTLTITDINENGETGDIVNAGGKIVNDGTLNIEGGNFESNSTNDAPVIENNGTTNISGGVISDNAVENNETEGGRVNITGGTLEGDDFDDFIDDDYTKNENNEIVKKPTIAKIGDVEYTSLIKAVAAVQDGDTIILEANEKFTEGNRTLNSGSWYDGLYYIGDKSFTIDLNGKTISHDDSVNDYLLNFKNVGSKANTITIKNGTLNAGTTAFCALCTASSNENQLTINLENVTIYNNRSNGSTAKIRGGAILNVKAGAKIIGLDSYLGIECVASTVNIYDGAEIYMNGTSSYNGCLAGACGGGTINVYGGYGKGVKGGFIAMTSGGTINISGGEWIANTDGTVGDNSNLYVLTAQSNIYESGFVGGAYINVTGGTFRGGMDAWVLNNVEGEEAKLNISGGNFNANPSSYLAEGCEVTEANGVWTVRVLPVAKIGANEYNTLQEAFNVGGDITLLRNVTVAETATLAEGKTAVFDLNGFNITAPEAGANGKHIYVLNNNGIMTIKDSKGNGSISARGIYNGAGNDGANITTAKLTIESGKFIGMDSDGGAAIFNYGELTVNGGTFNSIVASINTRDGSKATINGGTYSGVAQGSYVIQNNGGELTINNATVDSGFGAVGCYSGKTTINNGSFLPTGRPSATCHVVYVAGSADVTIKDGTFKMNYPTNAVPDSGSAVANYYKGTLAINGGTFYSHFDNVSPVELSSGSTITGGTYYTHSGEASQHVWIKNYIADGYELNANGEVVQSNL